MNTHSASPTTSKSHTAGAAVLVLDQDGRILVASAGARTLWQASATELVNDLFPNLFVFDVVSKDPDWVQSQWEVLVAAAQTQAITLKLQPKEAAAIDASVRLEKTGDQPVHYLAFISLAFTAAPAAAVPVTTPGAAPTGAADSFLTQLNERSPLGFFDLNFVKNEVYYSPTWKRMLGYPDSALANTYETWLALVHPEDSAAAPDRQGRGGGTGTRPFSLEFRMKHAQGHYAWVQSVGLQVYGPNGALQRVIGAHLDVSDRKEFEEAGLRAEERLQQLADRGRVGVFDLDFAGGLYWLSPGFKSLLGYDGADLPDTLESFLRVLPLDETVGGLQAYFLAQHPSQIAYFDTLRLRHRAGHEVLVYAGVTRQISRRKELQRVLGFCVPLPEGAAGTPAESSLGVSAAHLTALFAEVHEALLLTDAGGKVVFLNPKAEQLLGRSAAQCLDQAAWDVFRLVHRESGQPGESPVAKALTSGDATALNTEFALDAGGKTLPLAFSARAVIDSAGKPAGVVLVFRNPDEMSLTPEELVRSNRFESLGQIAGGIAHDFNNLLTTILGGVSLAKDIRDLSGLQNSESACLAAKGLTKQLLTFSKGGSGVRQVVKPADILAEAVRLAAAGSTVKVEVSVAADTNTICVDRAQILQVFQNLIINSIQAMTTGQGGQIWITAANIPLTEGQVAPLPTGNYVAIEVRDNGSGIKPEHVNKIFDSFFTTKKTGTGLGLATVLSIVKRHGGQMGLETEVGVGTAFTVYLPQADRPEEVEARRAPSLTHATRTNRILFMDDDEQIRTLTGNMLEGLEYKFDLARTGEEAIQFYKRYLNIGRPYDVVIMDLTVIGGMGGEQAFKRLRDLDPNVRAVVASGYDSDDMRRQFLDMGFLGYLTKPYRATELARVIKGVTG